MVQVQKTQTCLNSLHLPSSVVCLLACAFSTAMLSFCHQLVLDRLSLTSLTLLASPIFAHVTHLYLQHNFITEITPLTCMVSLTRPASIRPACHAPSLHRSSLTWFCPLPV